MASDSNFSTKTQFWSDHIEQCEVSGLRQKEYCDKVGIGLKSFQRWKCLLKKLRESSTHDHKLENGHEPLIPLMVVPDLASSNRSAAQQAQGAGIRLSIDGRFAIDLAIGFHRESLETLLRTLT